MTVTGELATLFFGSLLASTLVPGGVEGMLYLMVRDGEIGFWPLFSVATAGNTLGGVITWWVGDLLRRGLSRKGWAARLDRWFHLTPSSLRRIRRWGPAGLLLSWMPVIGDPLCLAAGYLSMPFFVSAAMIFIGKAMRYAVLLWILF